MSVLSPEVPSISPADPPRSAQFPPWLQRLFIVFGCLLGIAVNCFVEFPALPYIVHGDNDFMCFYSAAQLAGSGELYNPNAIARAEARLWDSPRALPYTRLPFYAALLVPLRFFSYRHAYWLWQLGSLAAALLFVYFWPAPRRWIAAMALCWSMPLLHCFFMGRDLVFLMPVLAVSLALLFRGKHFAAGCVLSLCLIKYNLFLPIPLLIVGNRLWKFGGGVVAGGAALMAISFAVAGWSWPWQYVAVLRLPITTPRYATMPNLHGLFSSLPPSVLLETAGTCAVLAAAWLVIRSGDIARAVSATLIGGLLISYHAFIGDALILVPACLLLLSAAPSVPLRLAAWFLLCPVATLPFVLPGSPYPPPVVLLLPVLVMVAEAILAGDAPWRAFAHQTRPAFRV
jgi:hypothetical protein